MLPRAGGWGLSSTSSTHRHPIACITVLQVYTRRSTHTHTHSQSIISNTHPPTHPTGNCNYGGVLIIWDKMFGTYEQELQQRDYYGLAKQYDTFDPVLANFEHYRRVVTPPSCHPHTHTRSHTHTHTGH